MCTIKVGHIFVGETEWCRDYWCQRMTTHAFALCRLLKLTPGEISPNFFAKQKVAGKRRLAKNSMFNFINKVVRLKLSQNLPIYVRHSPNAVCQKKCRILCARKIHPQILMKSTPGEISWRFFCCCFMHFKCIQK